MRERMNFRHFRRSFSTERAPARSRQPSGKFVAPEGVAAVVALLCGPGGRDTGRRRLERALTALC
jgi:hypothetical protein